MYKINTIVIIWITCFGLNSFSQKQPIKLDISNNDHFHVVNREIDVSTDGEGKTIVHLNTKPNDGVAWIKNVTFAEGIIELDVKGKNILQQSFVGVAFHGINDSTFDAVYFRPFNFTANDTMRRKHSVQYISMPKYDWSLLRQQHPGEYENALTKTVEPEEWFHAKIIVSNERIEVFVNNDEKSSLSIKPISDLTTGKIGFWVGNNSEGTFSNLTIQND
jgi:hypothetical protein